MKAYNQSKCCPSGGLESDGANDADLILTTDCNPSAGDDNQVLIDSNGNVLVMSATCLKYSRREC